MFAPSEGREMSTSKKQRVLEAAERRAPDRIPCDFHATPIVMERLYAHFKTRSYRGVLEGLGSDIVDIRDVVDPDWVADFPQRQDNPDGSFTTWQGFVRRDMDTPFGSITEYCRAPLADAASVEDLKAYRFPRVEWFDFSTIGERLREYGDFCVMASGPSVFQHATLIRGIDNFLMDMAADPDMANYLMDAFSDFHFAFIERLFAAAPGQINLVRVGDDFGMQNNQMISHEMMRRYIYPRIRRFADLAHKNGAKLMLHSCGSVDVFIEEIADTGVDILDPVQPLAKNMELGGLKERFGGKICFHGAIDTQRTLPHGSALDVRKEVYQRMALFPEKHGYIVAPAHTIQPDTPLENVLALYRAVHDFNDGIPL